MYKNFKTFVACLILTSLITTSCKSDENVENQDDKNIIAARFGVEIPDAISNSSASSNRVAAGELINGAVIYGNVSYFIAVGEISSKVIENIIKTIYKYNLSQPAEFQYVSKEDNRTKKVTIVENVVRNSVNWQYEMIIKDQDGAQAMQVLWNKAPIKGIAILSVYDLDRTEESAKKDARYMVEYDETGTKGYDAEMTVSLTGLPDNADKGWMSTLKMFVGKKGDIVEVFGNSDHPNFYFEYPTQKGRDYGFRARANQSLNIGVIEAGIPYSTTSTVDSIFHYTIEQVAYDVVRQDPKYDSIPDNLLGTVVDLVVSNEEAPGFFHDGKFQAAGLANMPSGKGYTSEFANLSALSPYKPTDIRDLTFNFINK
jgi:hypothetical protein